METLSKILKDYKPENIFNAGEISLLFRCLPQKTLTFKKEKCFGGKQSKTRLTVMLGANMTVHQKLKPLVIGRSKNPRCFKGSKSLEVDYDFNKKSCFQWTLVPVLLLLPISLTALAPLRGSCGEGRAKDLWSC
ncbi:Tigger transposable element-derived protein 4 [Araneus ventricosus]|uniref:Tigger transposable element-derived protein 4 n=1 Tax=Araneus ventricosus TaxID=182803 RepID=A0A4Y2T3S5_ARAVE|nr:Tigger transposable element-derived protein 4 [Araneus ventricosus]